MSDDKKITSLSSFRAKKDKPVEQTPDPNHPMGPKDAPELVPGFHDMPKQDQRKILEAFSAAHGFMEYAQDRADEIIAVATKIREQLDAMDQESGVLVASLLFNACAGCQYLGIGSPEAAIIFSSCYNQILTNMAENPPEEEKDKPN
jgi:hypothetical protein